jgi:DNA-binding beta-propeller fold protein YncE
MATGNWAGSSDYIYVTKFDLATGSTINSLTFNLMNEGGPSHAAIYDDNGSGTHPTTLLRETGTHYAYAGLNSFPITPIALPPGTYWLAVHSDLGVPGLVDGGPGDTYYFNFSTDYVSFPADISLWSPPVANFRWSVRADSCVVTPLPSATPTITPSPTITLTPVPCMAFGMNSPGSMPAVVNNYLGNAYYLGTTTDIYSLSFYLWGNGGQCHAAIYGDNGSGTAPTTLIEQTAVQTGFDGWNTFPIPTTTLPPGTYWLMVHNELGQGPGRTFTGSSSDYYAYFTEYGFGPFPATATGWTVSTSYIWTVRADSCPLGGTPTPTSTPQVPGYQFQWGGLGGGAYQFQMPQGAAVDEVSGTLYIADTLNNRVQIYNNLATFIGEWGVGGSGDGHFLAPKGIARAPNGDIYVADTNNHRVQRFDSVGTFLGKWGRNGGDGTSGFGNGEFNQPAGVAVNPLNGDVYVTDGNNARVQWFGPTGTYLGQWGVAGTGPGQFAAPVGLVFDQVGNVYVVDSGNARVQKFNAGGTHLYSFGSFGSGNGQFDGPSGITVSPSGYVFVVDSANSRVQMLTSLGGYILEWGMNGTGAGQFSNPRGIAYDPSRGIYVLDSGNHRVQVFGLP